MWALRWFGGGDYVPGVGAEHDDLWSWVTISLSVLVATGCGVIAVNWYFQSKLDRPAESKAALARLRLIVLACVVLGYAFYVGDTSWLLWRAYDLALLAVAVHTWSFAVRARGLGLGLVDERLAQVEQLERSAAKYRDIAELLPHVVWTAAADGRVDYANRRWAQYVGDGQGATPACCTWLDAVHPAERDDVLAWWSDAVAAPRAVEREVRLCGAVTPATPAGYRTFVVSATPIRHGSALKWLGACADVEDQKRAAAEKEQQAKQKSFFLNALSHDLRAPLNNVVLNAHLLKMAARDESERESAKAIIENAVAAGDLVSRLLEMAKAGAQDHTAAERVSLAALVERVERRFRPVAEQKGLYLRVEGNGAARNLELFTDGRKLERVVSNLVDNAIKFTRHGGVTIEPSAAPDGGSGGGAVVRVRDTGIGVPAADAPYLFDEFYQVNNHERDRSKGFGMGLAICRCLARQLGGDVRLAGTGPAGSCFEVVTHVGSTGADDGGRGRDHDADRGADGNPGAGGGGRRAGAAGDRADSPEPGLCRV